MTVSTPPKGITHSRRHQRATLVLARRQSRSPGMRADRLADPVEREQTPDAIQTGFRITGMACVTDTVDYLEHMLTGVLVPPKDPQALRNAIRNLAGDKALRRRIGDAGGDEVLRRCLLDHYAQAVAVVVKGRR